MLKMACDSGKSFMLTKQTKLLFFALVRIVLLGLKHCIQQLLTFYKHGYKSAQCSHNRPSSRNVINHC